MRSSNHSKFPPGVAEHLKSYVYRLIDPRNGETFYVGRGQGDRVFAHASGETHGDEISEKLKRIHAIRNAGFDVAHVIHRHGMSEQAAKEVEAALIDAYPGLTNVIGGEGGDFGVLHAEEIITRYAAEPAEFEHRALLINVSHSFDERGLYDATRFAWKINEKRAAQAEVILATNQGLIVGAFVAERWLPATAGNFPGLGPARKRHGFVGHDAPREMWDLYVGKRVPDEYRKRGAASPIRYTWP